MKRIDNLHVACVAMLLMMGVFGTSTSVSAASPRAAELLAQLSAGFRAMKGYTVTFAIAGGDRNLKGNYSIEGEHYYLTLGDAEVFCDGKVRYEIDNRRREVTISPIDVTSRNLLNNPAQAFDFLDSDYTAVLLWERDGKAAIRLTPTKKGASGVITLVVATASVRPQALTYDFDGEQVAVTISSIAPLAVPVKGFDRVAFSTYEMIDFR